MASAGGAGGRSPVRRHLAALVAANLFVLLVVGVAGIVGAIRAHDSVHYLTERVEPAVTANSEALQHLTDAETYLWGWAISGDAGLLTHYRASVTAYRRDRARLETLDAVDGQAALLVDDFNLATDDWFAVYVYARLEEPTGPETLNLDRFARGQRVFNEVRAANGAVGDRLAELTTTAAQRSEDLKRNIVASLAVMLLAGAALSWWVGSRVGRRVTEPLGALEQTAHRLAGGDHDARAPVSGPREVVQVATAVNRMADENDRARAVEARVVEQLRALDAVKSDFVSNVSHELRTPLTSILGYLELLEEELSEHPVDSEMAMVDATKRNVLRLGDLIDDLLALTQSEARRSDLVPLDLTPLVRDLITDLRVASSQQGVEIRLELAEGLAPVRADAGQLARVVTNLVSNAVKFSRGADEVRVSVAVDGTEAVITVEDHGIGIPAVEMDQVGSRFYRASNAVVLGITGTGLGLRIVQAIVENHHGTVDVRSKEGSGTTIRVRLPLHGSEQVETLDLGDLTSAPGAVG